MIIAVDPGDKHVGVAFFDRADNKWGWECLDAQEATPNEFLDNLAETIINDTELETVVYEIFRLYPDKAQDQVGSEMETSQMIGALKWMLRVHNAHATRHQEAEQGGGLLTCELVGGACHDPEKQIRPIHVVGQRADIQDPTRGILKHKGIKSVGRQVKRENPGWGDHVISAELHGWHYLLNGDGRG